MTQNINFLNENDNLSYLTYIRYNKDRNGLIDVHLWERIISYKEWLFLIDWFMIWRLLSNTKNKKFFNLEYIHSFKKWTWTKLLLTFLNKNNIKDISYIKSGSFEFWDKIEKIFKDSWIRYKNCFSNVPYTAEEVNRANQIINLIKK